MNVLFHTFDVLRGVSRERFSDLKLISECGRGLPVHKIIIAAVSSKLSGLISTKELSEISIKHVKFSALQNVVDFIYNKKVVLNNRDEAEDFAHAYNYLKVNLGAKANDTISRIEAGDETALSGEIDNSSQELLQFKCETCGKSFDTKKQFTRHSREVHDKDREKKAKNSFICENCKEIYKVHL